MFGFGVQGEGAHGPYRTRSPFVLDACELARFDPEAWRLVHDLGVLRALELEAGLDPAFAGELLVGLDDFCNTWDAEDRATWNPAGAILTGLYERHAAGGPHELSAIGHAHLDTAWLWPLAETRRKALRTFTTQVRLTDEYPEYVFCASQAQHYAWIREDDPPLFAAIRERVARGQWAPVGGTWIEPDCNLPAGESLARQLLHGQRFFERELGRRCTELWQPDVFGYTGQLPQLMREAGMTRFLTQKLSWNRFNRPEHHTFTWQGIDGSEVLTHFPPADTYNANATVAELRHGVRAYHDHDRSRDSLLVFGHGDGGGGPTRTMLERLRRARDLRGLPRTTVRHPEAFFDRLEAGARELRTIVGELYFELHRGTYTTQAGAQARQPPLRGGAPRRRARGGGRGAARARAVPADELAEAWQRAARHPVPRHPAGDVDHRGQRTRAGRPGRRRGDGRPAHAAALAALGDGGGGAQSVPVNTIPWRAARGGAGPGRDARARRGAAVRAGPVVAPGPTTACASADGRGRRACSRTRT